MTKTAIAFTHCRRMCYTTVSVEALLNCYGIDDIPIVYSADIHEQYPQESEDVCNYLQSKLRPQDVLLRNNPRLNIDICKFRVIKEALHLANRFIFLEDDLMPSKDALLFFESALDEFEKESNCICVLGYRRIIDKPATEINGRKLYRRNGFNPWGWAMWKDKYEALMGGIDSPEHGIKYKLDTGDDANGAYDGYWEHYISEDDRYAIRPELARVQNVGAHHGVHTTPDFFWENEYNKIWAGDLSDEELLRLSKLPFDYDLSIPMLCGSIDRSNLL